MTQQVEQEEEARREYAMPTFLGEEAWKAEGITHPVPVFEAALREVFERGFIAGGARYTELVEAARRTVELYEHAPYYSTVCPHCIMAAALAHLEEAEA